MMLSFFILLIFFGQNGGHAALQKPIVDVGVQGVVPNITLYGGVVVNDQKSMSTILYGHMDAIEHEEQNETVVNEILHSRKINIENLAGNLPFELLRWPVINSRPCPSYKSFEQERGESGMGISHMQMWLEFVFFDNDVLDARVRPTPEYITSNDYSSVSGIFTSFENGTLHKNNIPFLDEDIMIVLEDTVLIESHFLGVNDSPRVHNRTLLVAHLREALEDMDVDILSLGVPYSYTKVHSAEHATTNTSTTETTFESTNGTTTTTITTTITTTTTTNSAPPAGTDSDSTSNSNSNSNSKSETEEDEEVELVSAYAYAITRAGARKLLACYDHCGAQLQDQIIECAANGMLTHAIVETALFHEPEW